jgi:putative endonuclease
MPHFVYILYSETIDKYYFGSCSNIEERLLRHNAGATISTKPGRPWKVVYQEEFNSKTEVIKREIYLKRMKSRVFIELLIDKNKDGSSPG